MRGFERYSKLWSVTVVNHDDTFETCVWRDTAAGAERFVRGMYPNATVVSAYGGDTGWDYENEGA